MRRLKLSEGEFIVLVAGVVLIIDLLWLPWHSVDLGELVLPGFDTTRSGVQSPYPGYGLAAVILTAIMVLHVLVAKLISARLPEPRVPWAQIQLIAGVFVVVLLVVKLLRETEFLGFGAYSAILGGLFVAYGGYRIGQEAARPA